MTRSSMATFPHDRHFLAKFAMVIADARMGDPFRGFDPTYLSAEPEVPVTIRYFSNSLRKGPGPKYDCVDFCTKN